MTRVTFGSFLECFPCVTGVVTDLLTRARELLPLLRKNAPISDAHSSPLPETISALTEAGMFRLEVPPALGGFGASLREQSRVCAELAKACPSMAWLVGLNACAARLIQLRFPEVIGPELAEQPDLRFCSVGSSRTEARPVPGGWRVSGTGGFASGCEIADRIVLWGVAVQGDPGRRVSLLLRATDVDIERTWDFAGMRGTGSHTVVVTDAFVPDAAAVVNTFDPATRSFDNLPLPQQILSTIANALPAFAGAAHGALELVRENLARGKAISDTTYQRALDSPSARHWLAEATHLVETAYQHLDTLADALDADPGLIPMDLERRLRVRMHMSTVVTAARRAMEKTLDLAGAAAFAAGNPVQRLWRDLESGSRHARLNPFVAVEDYGRFLADGGTPVATLI